jgi:hypothetical protein
MVETNAIEGGTAPAFAINAVAQGAVAFEEPFAGGDIGAGRFFRRRLRSWPSCGEQAGGEECSEEEGW